jgi:uncharacterized protein (TIGR00369 family)
MAETRTRREIMQNEFYARSPLPKLLGITLERLEPDHAELSMPWDERLTTFADIVHGGAIATLIDTAGMVVTWSDDTVPDKIAGATATLSISYLAAARGQDLRAVAKTVRRGRNLCFSGVSVTAPDGRLIARGSVLQTY